MAKMVMPKKEREDEEVQPVGQTRQILQRFWLQVDRQTKSTYPSFEEAETAGKAIKAAHSFLLVSVYDAEKSEQTLVNA
jgi:hypothetical protein